MINDDKDDRPKKEDKGDVKKVDEEKKTKPKKKKKIQEVSHEWQFLNKKTLSGFHVKEDLPGVCSFLQELDQCLRGSFGC